MRSDAKPMGRFPLTNFISYQVSRSWERPVIARQQEAGMLCDDSSCLTYVTFETCYHDFPISVEPKTRWTDPSERSGCQRAGTPVPVPAVPIFPKSYKNASPTVPSTRAENLPWESPFITSVWLLFSVWWISASCEPWNDGLGELQGQEQFRFSQLCLSTWLSRQNLS